MSSELEHALRIQLKKGQIGNNAQRAVAANHPFPECFKGMLLRVAVESAPQKPGEQTSAAGTGEKVKRDDADQRGSKKAATHIIGSVVGFSEPFPTAASVAEIPAVAAALDNVDAAGGLRFVVDFGFAKGTIATSAVSEKAFTNKEHRAYCNEIVRKSANFLPMEELLLMVKRFEKPAVPNAGASAAAAPAPNNNGNQELVMVLEQLVLQLSEEKEQLNAAYAKLQSDTTRQMQVVRRQLEEAKDEKEMEVKRSDDKLRTLSKQVQDAELRQREAESRAKETDRLKASAAADGKKLLALKDGLEKMNVRLVSEKQTAQRYSEGLGRIAGKLGLDPKTAKIEEIEAALDGKLA